MDVCDEIDHARTTPGPVPAALLAVAVDGVLEEWWVRPRGG